MKYWRPVATILLLGGVITYFSINNNFEQALSKEQLKLTSEVSALSGEVITLESQLSGIRYQLLQKQNKLTLLNNLNGTKQIVEDKKDIEKTYTTGYSYCYDKDWVLSWMPDYYENYIYDPDCNAFAWFTGCYMWWQYTCLMFKDEQDKIDQIGE